MTLCTCSGVGDLVPKQCNQQFSLCSFFKQLYPNNKTAFAHRKLNEHNLP